MADWKSELRAKVLKKIGGVGRSAALILCFSVITGMISFFNDPCLVKGHESRRIWDVWALPDRDWNYRVFSGRIILE